MFNHCATNRLHRCWPVPLLLLLLAASGCGTKKYLNPGETYLTKNKIVFAAGSKVKNKSDLRYQLSTIYKQRPNEKFLRLFRTRLWFHHKTSDPGDTTKFDRWVKRVIAEPPAIFDETIANSTAKSMQYYLQNKGYYDAQVSYDAQHRRHSTTVTYTIKPYTLYQIDSVFLQSEDPQILSILREIQEESHLRPGAALSKSVFDKENQRVITILKNRGYAFFDDHFIDPVGDTTDFKGKVYYNILPPKGKKAHQVYTIGRVNVNPQYRPGSGTQLLDTLIDEVQFSMEKGQSFIKPGTLLKAIFLRPDTLYQEEQFKKTYEQLSKLDIYRFIALNPSIDSLDASKLNFNIFLTPKPRMVAGFDWEINTSNFNTTENQVSLYGTAASISYKNRNLFKNATALTTELYTGFEFDFGRSTGKLVFSRDINASVGFEIPKFNDLNGAWSLMNRLHIIRPRFYQKLREKARTRLSLNYDNLSIFNFYSYHSFNTSLGYELQINSANRLRVNTLGVNFLLPTFEENFETIRQNNPFLERSFDKQLFTGFLFRDVNFVHTGKANRSGQSWYFSANFEQSGAEVLAAKGLYNDLSSSSGPLTISQADFEQYLRLEADVRTYFKFATRLPLALRFNSGVAVPFGPYTRQVPYVKQFAVGGPYSIRAWKIRELGPGSYIDPIQSDSVPFFQAGDFKMEFNAEYRFDIFSPFEGALFIDGGNIWTLKTDPDRPGSKLSRNFYKEIALGTGFGLRLDFKYFIIRFDMGVKMRKPYIDPEDPDDSYWLFKDWRKYQWKDINFNLAIGQPF